MNFGKLSCPKCGELGMDNYDHWETRLNTFGQTQWVFYRQIIVGAQRFLFLPLRPHFCFSAFVGYDFQTCVMSIKVDLCLREVWGVK